MKKNRKTALMAAVLTGAAMLTSCDVGHDDVQDVYGPPVTEAAATEDIQTEYGAPAAEEVTTTSKPVTVPAVYGPPETETFTTDAITEPVTTGYDPSKDEVQDVYGPPVTEKQEEAAIPYSPIDDTVQLVYGPPESFGN